MSTGSRKTFNVRVDYALHQALTAWAKQDGVSLNTRIETILRRAMLARVPYARVPERRP